MATYTAVIGDVTTIGRSVALSTSFLVSTNRRSPQVASARVRTIMNPHIVSDSIGGLISADFTIPAEEALRLKPSLKYGAVVWMFDGRTPIFYGWAAQPVWTQTGDCQMTLLGPWQLLGTIRWREAWSLWDLTVLKQGLGDNRAGSVTLTTNPSLDLSFPQGATLAANDTISAEYTLYDEPIGNFDARLIQAFEFNVRAVNNLGASFQIQVLGKPAGDLLWSGSTTGGSLRQGAQNLHATNQGGLWPRTGYRTIRIQLKTTLARTPLGNDTLASFDRIRFSTREALFESATGSPADTGAIAEDMLLPRWSNGAFGYFSTPLEFWASNYSVPAGDETAVYGWGRDPVVGTGTAPLSNVGVTGFTALDWQSPAEILTSLAAIDGYNVGFYLPYNGALGYDPPGAAGTDVGSFWLSAPPQLYWQPWADPASSPDYTIHTQEGAQVTPQPDQQGMSNLMFVNYQTLRGVQQSVGVLDSDAKNYLSAQGYVRADDFTVEPSIGDSSIGTSLGTQALNLRRNPSAAASVVIEQDGSARYPILKQGAVVTKLATIRPGSVRISDVPAASGLRSAYATHVEWWGQTIDSNERVELTLSSPGQMRLDRRLGWLALRANKQRVRNL